MPKADREVLSKAGLRRADPWDFACRGQRCRRMNYFRIAQARPSGCLPAEIFPIISKDFRSITAT